MYAIYGNIYHQYTPNVSIYIYIYHTWILWAILSCFIYINTPLPLAQRICFPGKSTTSGIFLGRSWGGPSSNSKLLYIVALYLYRSIQYVLTFCLSIKPCRLDLNGFLAVDCFRTYRYDSYDILYIPIKMDQIGRSVAPSTVFRLTKLTSKKSIASRIFTPNQGPDDFNWMNYIVTND